MISAPNSFITVETSWFSSTPHPHPQPPRPIDVPSEHLKELPESVPRLHLWSFVRPPIYFYYLCFCVCPPPSQFNTAARHLIELDKPSDSSGDSGEGPSTGPQSNGAQRVGEKKNSKKRHSFTSLTMSHKPMLAPPPQRHSMEISGPVLISSSNPTAAARIGEISGGLSCSAPSQVQYSTPPVGN